MLFKVLLIGYLYGITLERRLIDLTPKLVSLASRVQP